MLAYQEDSLLWQGEMPFDQERERAIFEGLGTKTPNILYAITEKYSEDDFLIEEDASLEVQTGAN